MPHWSENAKALAEEKMGGSSHSQGVVACPAKNTGLIVQVIRSEAEQYVENIRVQAKGAGTYRDTTSESLGAVVLQPIPEGDYEVGLSFASEMEKGYKMDPEPPQDVTVELGKVAFVQFDASVCVEIQLTDEKGEPAKDYKYSIEQPEGTVIKQGQLDAEGKAQISESGELNIGECKVSFAAPEEDLPAPAPETNWIVIELFDQDGQPYKDQDYELWKEGEPRAFKTGKLNDKGIAKIEDLSVDVSQLRVVFPFEEDEIADPEPETNWIVIELFDKDGQPYKDQDFELWKEGEARAFKTGKLNEKGIAKIEDLSVDVSQLRVVFPFEEDEIADPEPETNWIVIELFDKDGQPYKDQDFELWKEGEDQAFKTGKLNDKGIAKFEDLSVDVSQLRVVFPFEQDEMADPEPETNWIVIELYDKDGEPYKDQKFELWEEDGKEAYKTGTLDANGKAKFEDIGSDVTQLQVVFPDLE